MTDTAPKSPRFSLCISSTCIAKTNCKNIQQVTYTAYQIAKAACTYNVAEIVVLKTEEEEEEGPLLLASLLQFFITPPYLVSDMFKDVGVNKKNFDVARTLPKITTLPFMNAEEKRYKEGMTISKDKTVRRKTNSGKVKKIKKSEKQTKYVNIGAAQLFELEKDIPTGVRVTVDTTDKAIVSPLKAYGTIGTNNSYGYQVRMATGLESVFTESGFEGGYDSAIIGVCGEFFKDRAPETIKEKVKKTEPFSGNCLVVVSSWRDLVKSSKESPEELFDSRIDIPSKSRVEDGCLIALAALHEVNTR